MASSTFYYNLKRLQAEDKDEELKDCICSIYLTNKCRDGYRIITDKLRKQGYHVNRKRVQRLMQQLGLRSLLRPKRKNYQKNNEPGKVAPNILQRNFHADRPNKKWATDITEFKLFGKKLYLSPIIDLFNGEIICYDISNHQDFEQITNMLDKAFLKIPNKTRLILHSDQGWQYTMDSYQSRLKAKGIRQSMSRRGNCLDNAVIESFFGTLKSELFYYDKFESIEHLKKEIEKYIDYYNNKRIKLRLKGMSPVEYRTKLAA